MLRGTLSVGAVLGDLAEARPRRTVRRSPRPRDSFAKPRRSPRHSAGDALVHRLPREDKLPGKDRHVGRARRALGKLVASDVG